MKAFQEIFGLFPRPNKPVKGPVKQLFGSYILWCGVPSTTPAEALADLYSEYAINSTQMTYLISLFCVAR